MLVILAFVVLSLVSVMLVIVSPSTFILRLDEVELGLLSKHPFKVPRLLTPVYVFFQLKL